MKIPGLAALAATLALACSPANVVSGGGGSGGGGVSATAIAGSCSDYAYAYCGHLQTCSPTALETRFGNAKACEAIEEAQCTNAATAPSSSFTLGGKAACTQALADWDCSDFLHSANAPPACQTAPGPLAEGAVCSVAAQCQTGFCGVPAGSGCGTCLPVPQAGASCAVIQCPNGLLCTGTPLICTAYVGAGVACSSTVPCNTGLSCVGGTCQPAVTVAGAPCVFDGAGCDFFSGLACNAQSATCQTARLEGPGDACGVVENQNASCIMGSCPRGACVADVPPGGACNLTGPECLSPSHCVVSADGGTSGTCELYGSVVCD